MHVPSSLYTLVNFTVMGNKERTNDQNAIKVIWKHILIDLDYPPLAN